MEKSNRLDKLFFWLKERWKIVVGVIVGLLGVLSIALRLRGSKKVLDKANESHEKENKANQDALEETVDILQDIADISHEKTQDAVDRHTELRNQIEKDKKEFSEKASKSDSLGRDIAEHLGAEYLDLKK